MRWIIAVLFMPFAVQSATLFDIAAAVETEADRIVVDAGRYLQEASTPAEDRSWERKQDENCRDACRGEDSMTSDRYTQTWILNWVTDQKKIEAAGEIDQKTMVMGCRILRYCAKRRICLPPQIVSRLTPEIIAQGRAMLQEKTAQLLASKH